ncbi:MAG TPA: hypothetical protein VGN75_12240 [Kaistia sp.]|nr:hypothetical protein [Kaistia sp.]
MSTPVHAELYYVVDLRPEWQSKPYVTFWRPKNAGYSFPLPWAGRYTRAEIEEGGSYYTKNEGRRRIRFAVPCATADAMGAEPDAKMIDGDVGPVVFKTPANRKALIAARLRLAFPLPTGGT